MSPRLTTPLATIGRCNVAAVAALPGPVTGMTLATEKVLTLLSAKADLNVFDLAGGGRGDRPWKAWKAYRSILAIAWLLIGQGRNAKTVYFAANAQWGLLYTVAIAMICRICRKRIVLHHHVCSYTSSRHLLMACVQNLMRSSDLNLVLGREQSEGIAKLYSPAAASCELPYGYMATPKDESVKRESGQVLKIGHMCNLTVSKGLLVVLQSFERLIEQGKNVELVLAGPTLSNYEKSLVEDAVQRWPEQVKYLGPVYGIDKWSFFEAVDCFFFPTRYENEAQPIVLVESMAHGLPLVSTDQGCIASLVQPTGCPIVTREKPLVESCVEHLIRMADDTAYFNALAERTLEASRELHDKSVSAINLMISNIDGNVDETIANISTGVKNRTGSPTPL